MSTSVSRSEAETMAVAERLGARFRGGEVVLLEGALGAGKTAFVRGLARGVGAAAEEVASPTFVLLTTYPGRLTLHHADLYRLGGGDEDRELGLEELPGPRGVLAVEWAERLSFVPWPRPWRVRIAHAGGDERRIEIEEER
ncbi:MAG TPA: tRNA (adenosine(37)-N6)-threonylcarbamoyltransferase complex ATPase subunit type 1 TsaE [Vicinamibacteria bacterium]|nr:tRNA (adenosine(37)-N6)-threonylcarbamoyltransferase complex ATPase subunit type 1 TsaE [Vicinamibacteria bacterium]